MPRLLNHLVVIFISVVGCGTRVPSRIDPVDSHDITSASAKIASRSFGWSFTGTEHDGLDPF